MFSKQLEVEIKAIPYDHKMGSTIYSSEDWMIPQRPFLIQSATYGCVSLNKPLNLSESVCIYVKYG